MELLHRAATWILRNSNEFFEIVITLYACVNILWAQLPQPKTVFGRKLWMLLHGFFQLIVTHKLHRGTFTWPWLVWIGIRAYRALSIALALPDRERPTKPPEKPERPLLEFTHLDEHKEVTPVEVPHPSLHPDRGYVDESPTPLNGNRCYTPRNANPLLDLDEIEPSIVDKKS